MCETRKFWPCLFAILAAVLGLEGGLRDAYGYVCAGEPLHVYPASGTIPTNAELRVVFPGSAAELYVLGENRQVLSRGEVTAQNPRFSLRGATGECIMLRSTQLSGPLLPTFVLQLPQPLHSGTTYTLQAHDPRTDQAFPLADYSTSAGPDVIPPTLLSSTAPGAEHRRELTPQQVQGVRFYHLSHAGYKEAHGPWLEFSIAAADDGGHVYYEILDDKPGAARLLAVGQSAEDGTLRLGRWNICRASELEFRASGILALSVRAVDRAGRTSAPASFSVDLSHPRRKR